MFPSDVPIVEVSIDANLDPQRHIDIGKALNSLRQRIPVTLYLLYSETKEF
jgi:aromatic ring-opening dioxygenase catalytic subunit (LigB family)